MEPNTPVELRRGVLVFAHPSARSADAVADLFARVGTVVELPEQLIDVAGAVPASAPPTGP